MSTWLDEYWDMLQQITNSMRNKPNFRTKWAKFINSPKRVYKDQEKNTLYSTPNSFTVDYNVSWEASKAHWQEHLKKVKEWTEKTTKLIQDGADATNNK
ncbi:hypothetical protein TWF694_011483 [Orbilia ellipsospora]|uniref:Uncharacterized protein n=1 Tax=Orbilia ellipsospora TaxID=2528407 RepID=A0AAV9X5C2_9PEZI